ncbi:MAG: GTPase Era [Polyangia bacterium]|jgi:GTP-binding protein Era|nr:GTPase Era [Polyangia bacterium]
MAAVNSTGSRTDEQPTGDAPFVSGFVTLLGVPNVGKSTLLNRLLGGKVAIVSPKPQTTRDRILGVITAPGGQIVLLDTPGIHDTDRALNSYMVRQAFAALGDADVAVLVVDAAAAARGRGAADQETEIAERAAELEIPLVVCLNKIDLVADKSALLPLMEPWREARAVVPLSALEGDGVDRLLGELWPLLPEGPAYFDGDSLTDRSLRWLAGEAIREQVFLLTRKEIPYSTAVQVERFLERPDRGDVVVEAVVFVERQSQKGIVVGRGGQKVKEIGTAARLELARLLERPVHLTLRVAVASDWARSPAGMRRVGYEP